MRRLAAVIASAAVLAVTACSHGAVAARSHAATSPAIVNGVPGKHVRRVSGVSLPAAAAQVAAPVSATWQITPSGKLPGPAVVEIPLERAESDDGLTVVFTSESPSGPWLPLKTKIVRGGRYAQVTVTHLSFFTVVRISVDKALAELKRFFGSFSGGAFSGASAPDCHNTGPQARTDGYSITSAHGSTMFWCFGVQNGQRVLKVVNNRRYPLLLIHGMPVIGGGGGDVFQLAARLLSTSGVVAYPQDEVDFGANIQPGRWAGISADLADEAQLLSSLDVGVTALFTIITRFGAKEDPNKVMKVVDKMLSLDACRAALSDIGAMLSACFSPHELYQAFGFPWGWLLAPVAAASAAINYFHGALNGLADQFDGRSRYWIDIKHAVVVTPYSSYLGRWYVHDGELCAGQRLGLSPVTAGATDAPCSGSAAVGWERDWGCSWASSGCGYLWLPLAFARHADGTVTITVTGKAVCTSASSGSSGTAVPCTLPPEGVEPGTRTASLVTPGVIKVTDPSGYWGGGSTDWCSASASQATYQRYCPNA